MLRRTLYEIDTARQVLPLVRSIVRDIVEEFHLLRDAGRTQRELEARPILDGTERKSLRAAKSEAIDASSRIERYLQELEDMGIELRDLETGLVDFPTLVNGEPAYYCWKPGDEDIRWWHAATQGFADRRPVPTATPA